MKGQTNIRGTHLLLLYCPQECLRRWTKVSWELQGSAERCLSCCLTGVTGFKVCCCDGVTTLPKKHSIYENLREHFQYPFFLQHGVSGERSSNCVLSESSEIQQLSNFEERISDIPGTEGPSNIMIQHNFLKIFTFCSSCVTNKPKFLSLHSVVSVSWAHCGTPHISAGKVGQVLEVISGRDQTQWTSTTPGQERRFVFIPTVGVTLSFLC